MPYAPDVPTVIDDAICIRHWDWSETSQTVTLFCRTLGVVRGLAKGAKRPKSPFSGGIELLTRGRVGVIHKPSSELATLTEWDLLLTYPVLRDSLRAHQAGVYLADLANQFVRDHDPHPALFDALHLGLTLLRADEPVWHAVVGFQWCTLVETGFRPELFHDARTGEVLDPEAPTLGFDPNSGGVVRDPGGPGGGGVVGTGVWRVRSTTVEFLRQLAAHEAGTPIGPFNDEQSVERAARLLGAYVCHVLGLQPPTHAGLLGPDQTAG